jgi:hypothetical protein
MNNNLQAWHIISWQLSLTWHLPSHGISTERWHLFLCICPMHPCPVNSTVFLSKQAYMFSLQQRARAQIAASSCCLRHLQCPVSGFQVVTDMFPGFLKQMQDDGNSWKSSCFGLISSGSPIRPLWTFCTFREKASQPNWFRVWNSILSFFAFGRIVLLWPMYRLHIWWRVGEQKIAY